MRFESAPVNRLDVESLQRGARTFVNYCLNCHTAKYMRYNRLTDLGIDAAMIQDNLMFATDKIGETMTVAMTAQDARAWFGAPPPDLTVEARIRGTDWLYNYFLGFYKDDNAASGWNNLVFPNVGMPHVLWEQSGVYRLVSTEYDTHDDALAAAIAVKGLVVLAPAKNNKFVVESVALDKAGNAHAAAVPGDGRRSRQLHGLHGGAGKEQADHHRSRRADVPRRAVRVCLLAQAGILEGRSLMLSCCAGRLSRA